MRQEPFVSSCRRDYEYLTETTALVVIVYPHIPIVDTLVSGGQEILPVFGLIRLCWHVVRMCLQLVTPSTPPAPMELFLEDDQAWP